MKKIILIVIVCFSAGLFAQTSQNMTLLANWDDNTLPIEPIFGFQYNDIWGYTDANGIEYAIIGGPQHVLFFDLSDPTNPVEKARVEPGGFRAWRDFKVWEDYAYGIIEDSEGLSIYDMTDIANNNVTVTTNNTHFGSAHNLYVDENGRIYVCGVGNNLIVFDAAANPANPVYLGTINLAPWGGYVHDLYVKNNKAYCSSGGDGLFVYDVSDIGNVALLGSVTTYPEQGYNHNVWVNEDESHMVWTDETFDTGMKLANITDLSDINVTDVFRATTEAPLSTASVAHNAYMKDGYIIASYYGDGVQIFDACDPENVELVAWYDTYSDNNGTGNYQYFGNWGVYPFFESGILIASDTKYGLFVLQLDHIRTLVETVNIQGAGGATTISVPNGTLQMEQEVLPLDASCQQVIWRVINQTGEATINSDGILTAVSNGEVIVQAEAYDGSGVIGSAPITILNQNVGVGELNGLETAVFPSIINASKDVNIHFSATPADDLTVTVVDLMGQILFEENYAASKMIKVNLPEMPSGVYLIQIEVEREKITKKISVQ